VGLLEPAGVDPDTGYRYYATDQIPTAQVIKRFRALDMPIDEIRAVLTAPDVQERNALIAAHLGRLEQDLARTQAAVTSLRDLLQPATPEVAVRHRRVEATPTAAITGVMDVGEALPWLQGALGELDAVLTAQHLRPAGPSGGIFATELFTHDRGETTIFVPCAGPLRAMGRVTPLVIPAAELATTVHPGSHGEIDRAYGALGAYVTEHALGVDGPIREYYLVGRTDTSDQEEWRTEIGWPIFQTG
jgi:DNA-binding transcriptional MerR regulator